MTYSDILRIADFLGDDMDDQLSERLFVEARRCCSISELEALKAHVAGNFYTLLSQLEGEMGGFARY